MTENNQVDFDRSLLPRQNSHFIGHQNAEYLIKMAFDNNRMPHAWLISGPKGVGKATLAFRFARYVLSNGENKFTEKLPSGLFSDKLIEVEKGNDLDEGPLYISPNDPVFKRIANGGHADFMYVERTINEKTGKLRSEIVVDDVRPIGSFFHFTAGEGGWRIVVIDCADEMNIHAANAVLKVLEEPPPKALLLLVCHNPGQLLGTIRSRCRMLALQPLKKEIVSLLVRKWFPELEDDLVDPLIALANGSPGRAYNLGNGIGLEVYQDMMALLGTLPSLDVEALHSFSEKLIKNKEDDLFRMIFELLLWWISRVIVSIGIDDSKFENLTKFEKNLMNQIGNSVGLDRWFRLWEKVNFLLKKSDQTNLDRKQVVLNVFLAIENTVRL